MRNLFLVFLYLIFATSAFSKTTSTEIQNNNLLVSCAANGGWSGSGQDYTGWGVDCGQVSAKFPSGVQTLNVPSNCPPQHSQATFKVNKTNGSYSLNYTGCK